MASRNYDMATNMENRNIQQALSRYNMRNNDYEEPNIFKYGTSPIVRTDRGQMAMNNRALERKIGGSMCGCEMRGGAINSVLSEMDERFDGMTNKNFTSPYRKSIPQYIQNGQLNFVPYYNMVEIAQINSRGDADNVLRGRGIDYGKYLNQAKNILGTKVKDQVVEYVKPTLNQVKTLMKDPEVKQLAQDAINDPEVRRAVGKILNDAKDLAIGGSIYSTLGSMGAKALTTGAKVGATAAKYGATAAKAGAKYGATAVAVGSKYGAKGVAVASAVASNKVVQKIASDVAENPAVQEAVVGLIASQIASLAPTPAPAPEEEEETPTGGRFRGKRGKRGGMFKIKEALKKLKTKLKGEPTTTQITLAEYEDDDDTFREDEDDDYEEAKKKVKGERKPDLEMRDLRSGSGMRRRKRGGMMTPMTDEELIPILLKEEDEKQLNNFNRLAKQFASKQQAKKDLKLARLLAQTQEAEAKALKKKYENKLKSIPESPVMTPRGSKAQAEKFLKLLESEKSGSGMKGGKNKRALIVKKVMKEKGLGLIEASKYVKAHGLY